MQIIILILFIINFSFAVENVIIEADKLEKDKEILTATGNVIITSQGKILKSNKVIYNTETKKATLPEKFYVKTDTFEGYANSGWFDFENDTGEMYEYDGVVEKKYYVKGKYLKKEKDVYYFTNGEFSACPPTQYDWNIKASSGKIKEQDKLQAYNMRFNFCKIPILYTPYFSYPTTNRKSGLLTPTIGKDTYNTFIYKQPLFIVINDYSDTTFTLDYRNKQGTGSSIEYRRMFDKDIKLLSQIDFFKESENMEWWQNRTQTPLTNRYRFYLETNYSYFQDWQFFTKLDFVSDRYFFEDLYNNSQLKYTSFTKSYLIGRNETEKYQLELDFDYFYDLTTADNKSTLQRLPELRFYWKESKLLDLPIYYDFLSDNTYFYREEGTSGIRSDNILRLSNYTYFGKIINNIEVSPEFTLYINSKDKNTLDRRLLIPIKDSLYTTFMKSYKNFSHLIIPKIVFEYTNKIDQSNLPYYDRTDRINEKKDLTFQLYNILNFKNNNFLRWELSQGYTFLNYYFIGDNIYYSHIKPLKNSILLNIDKYSLDSTTFYDLNKKYIVRSISSLSFPINNYITYSLSYSHDRGTDYETSQKQLSNSVSANYKNFSLNANIINNIKDRYIQRKFFSLNWNRGCWSLTFGFWEDYNKSTDKKYKNFYILINILDIHYNFPFVKN